MNSIDIRISSPMVIDLFFDEFQKKNARYYPDDQYLAFLKFITDKFKIRKGNWGTYVVGDRYLTLYNLKDKGTLRFLECLKTFLNSKVEDEHFAVYLHHSTVDVIDAITNTFTGIIYKKYSSVFNNVIYFSKSKNESFNLEFMIKNANFIVNEREEISKINELGYDNRIIRSRYI